MCYQDWLKAKDAEKRLRRKLVGQAQNQIKEELLTVAKQEREKYEYRTKAMDDWLMQKKIDEAEKIAHMRELDRREDVGLLGSMLQHAVAAQYLLPRPR